MPEKLRSGWSRFLMSLFSRTPERISFLRAIYAEELTKRRSKVETSYDEWCAKNGETPSEDQKANDVRREQEIGLGRLMQSVMDLERVGTHLNNMLWGVFSVPSGKRTLLTSDHPTYLHTGLQKAESYLTLPISPTKLFVAANEVSTLKRIEAIAPCDIATNSNRVVTLKAKEFVYGVDDFQINVVEKNLRAG